MAAKGTVGVIRPRHHGRRVRADLAAADWRVIGYRPRSQATAGRSQGGVEIMDAPPRCAEAATIIHQPAEPARPIYDTAKAIIAAKAGARVVIEGEHIRDRRQAQGRAARSPRPATPCSIARWSGTGRAGARQDIIIYASGDPKAIRSAPAARRHLTRNPRLGAFGTAAA